MIPFSKSIWAVSHTWIWPEYGLISNHFNSFPSTISYVRRWPRSTSLGSSVQTMGFPSGTKTMFSSTIRLASLMTGALFDGRTISISICLIVWTIPSSATICRIITSPVVTSIALFTYTRPLLSISKTPGVRFGSLPTLSEPPVMIEYVISSPSWSNAAIKPRFLPASSSSGIINRIGVEGKTGASLISLMVTSMMCMALSEAVVGSPSFTPTIPRSTDSSVILKVSLCFFFKYS